MKRHSKSLTITVPAAAAEKPQNQALDRCIAAWQRTFDLAFDDPDNQSLVPDNDNETYIAYRQAAIAFREAMPPLAGAENIRDFIACLAYAILRKIFSKDECEHLNSVAKLALALLRAEPKTLAPSKP